MPETAVRTKTYAQPCRVAYRKKILVEFCPWIRTESLETQVLVSDLIHSLGGPFGPAEAAARQRRLLAQWATLDRVVDQYAADGTLLATYARRVAPDEIWRLPLGRAARPCLEYGLLVFRGPYTLNHFQIVGPRTFATCHSRRFLLDEPPSRYARGIVLPAAPGVHLSVFLMNRGAQANTMAVYCQAEGDRQAQVVRLTLPRLGSRIVPLTHLFTRAAAATGVIHFYVDAGAPFDFYTLIENGAAGEETFSIQHIK